MVPHTMHLLTFFLSFFVVVVVVVVRNASSHLKVPKRESKNYLDPLCIC